MEYYITICLILTVLAAGAALAFNYGASHKPYPAQPKEEEK